MTDMDEGARKWLFAAAHKNKWRVPSTYEFVDLVQDGYWHWSRIVHRYEVIPNRIRARKHLMSLFKITYVNHLNDLSKRKTRQPEEVSFEDLTPHVLARMQFSAAPDLIGLAPPLVKLAFVAMMADSGLLRLRSRYRLRLDGTRQTLNERLCSMTGLDPKVIDLPGEMRKYLHGYSDPIALQYDYIAG